VCGAYGRGYARQVIHGGTVDVLPGAGARLPPYRDNAGEKRTVDTRSGGDAAPRYVHEYMIWCQYGASAKRGGVVAVFEASMSVVSPLFWRVMAHECRHRRCGGLDYEEEARR